MLQLISRNNIVFVMTESTATICIQHIQSPPTHTSIAVSAYRNNINKASRPPTVCTAIFGNSKLIALQETLRFQVPVLDAFNQFTGALVAMH